MEPIDLELIKVHISEDRDLAGLYKEHVDYEKKLAKLDNKLFLTPEEEVLRKELQKKKLLGKDRLENLLKKYRNGASGQK